MRNSWGTQIRRWNTTGIAIWSRRKCQKLYSTELNIVVCLRYYLHIIISSFLRSSPHSAQSCVLPILSIPPALFFQTRVHHETSKPLQNGFSPALICLNLALKYTVRCVNRHPWSYLQLQQAPKILPGTTTHFLNGPSKYCSSSGQMAGLQESHELTWGCFESMRFICKGQVLMLDFFFAQI